VERPILERIPKTVLRGRMGRAAWALGEEGTRGAAAPWPAQLQPFIYGHNVSVRRLSGGNCLPPQRWTLGRPRRARNSEAFSAGGAELMSSAPSTRADLEGARCSARAGCVLISATYRLLGLATTSPPVRRETAPGVTASA